MTPKNKKAPVIPVNKKAKKIASAASEQPIPMAQQSREQVDANIAKLDKAQSIVIYRQLLELVVRTGQLSVNEIRFADAAIICLEK